MGSGRPVLVQAIWIRYRSIDVHSPDGVIRECRTGIAHNSPRLRSLAERDAALVDAHTPGITKAHWHFVTNARNGSLGADPALVDLLDARGITYTLHVRK